MKKNDQNKRLKHLSDQHEVPFNPAAWEKMDALLDNTPPPEPPRPGASFFNYKNILAMIILLLILMYFVVPTGDDINNDLADKTTATITSQDNYIFENNDTVKQKTKEIFEKKLKKNTPQIDPGDTYGNIISPDYKGKYPISRMANVTLVMVDTSINEPVNIFTKTVPSNPSFVQNIEEQLLTYHQFRAEEKVYLHFDRTMLKPGETLWFSAYVRDANNLQPSAKSELVYVEFIAPNGGVLKQFYTTRMN